MHWPILPSRTAQRVGIVSCLVRQRKLRSTEVEFQVPFSSSLFCTDGLEKFINGWFVEVSYSIHTLFNSQSPTVSQNTLQGHNQLWKDVFISYSKALSGRHLKFAFPYRNLSSAKQTIYPFVLRIMWLWVDKTVEPEEVWDQKSISVNY